MRTIVRTSIIAVAVACCASACAQPGCVIKGNISSSGERIYHVPGQRYYDKTLITGLQGERWFCTEQEAVRCRLAKSQGLTLRNVGPSRHGLDEQMVGSK